MVQVCSPHIWEVDYVVRKMRCRQKHVWVLWEDIKLSFLVLTSVKDSLSFSGWYVNVDLCVLRNQTVLLHSKRSQHVLLLWGNDCESWACFKSYWVSAIRFRQDQSLNTAVILTHLEKVIFKKTCLETVFLPTVLHSLECKLYWYT